MGACCDAMLQKEEIHTNESRLKILQNKIAVSYHSENDNKFTYYLNVFQQHQFLERILQDYKTEHTHNTSFTIKNQQLDGEYEKLIKYSKDYANNQSDLHKQIKQDQQKIAEQYRIYNNPTLTLEECCMVKLQIQGIQLVHGISRIGIVQQTRLKNSTKKKEEFVIVNRMKSEKIYREVIFPTAINSKLQIVTDPIIASVTIDVEDIARDEVLCSIFTFKDREKQFGFIALRLQLFTTSQKFRRQKQQRLFFLEKELKLCKEGGIDKLSQYRSDASSHRNTFISQAASEYPNQYQV